MDRHYLLSTTEVQILFDGIGSPNKRSKKIQADENEFLTGNTSSTRSSIVMEEARESADDQWRGSGNHCPAGFGLSTKALGEEGDASGACTL